MNIDIKNEFETIEQGTTYNLPCYEVQDTVGIVLVDQVLQLKFVRGSKEGTKDVKRSVGTLHEHLLSAMIFDLKHKNNLVPSRETSLAITKLEEALHWLWARQVDRQSRQVLGTYQK